MVHEAPGSVLLITIRVRLDKDFPEAIFMTLRRHLLTEDLAVEEVRTAASADAALDIVGGWLEGFHRKSLE